MTRSMSCRVCCVHFQVDYLALCAGDFVSLGKGKVSVRKGANTRGLKLHDSIRDSNREFVYSNAAIPSSSIRALSCARTFRRNWSMAVYSDKITDFKTLHSILLAQIVLSRMLDLSTLPISFHPGS